jgi:cytochrome c
MDSFELNKFLGAILGTCLVLLVTNFTAGALFAPAMPEKPGYEIAVKEEAHGGDGKEAAGKMAADASGIRLSQRTCAAMKISLCRSSGNPQGCRCGGGKQEPRLYLSRGRGRRWRSYL